MVKDKVRKAPRRNMAITFDMDARKEYLTGFHKRKLERQKLGRAEMEMRARREKLAERKERRNEIKAAVTTVDENEGGPAVVDSDRAELRAMFLSQEKKTTTTITEVNVEEDPLLQFAKSIRAAEGDEVGPAGKDTRERDRFGNVVRGGMGRAAVALAAVKTKRGKKKGAGKLKGSVNKKSARRHAKQEKNKEKRMAKHNKSKAK